MPSAEVAHCAFCGTALSAPPPTRCASCGGYHYRNAVPCAGAVVVREGELLLMRRAAAPYEGRWDLPGGFCEETEHPRDAARREVREEVGLDVEIGPCVGIWLDTYDVDAAGPPRTTLNIYYLAEPVEDNQAPAAGSEAGDASWFAFHALPEPLAFPDSTPPAIAAALSLLERRA